MGRTERPVNAQPCRRTQRRNRIVPQGKEGISVPARGFKTPNDY